MQTILQYQQRINKQKSVRYVLPGSLQDRYKQFDPNMEEVLRNTERCPFTTIRQLIISFGRNDTYSTDVQPSDILLEKYSTNPQLTQVDSNLNKCIHEVQQSQIHFQKLLRCVDHYNDLYNSLTKQEQNIQRDIQGKETKAQFNQRVFRKQNEKYLTLENKYFQYLTYSQQLQRALVLASASQASKFRPQNSQNNPISGVDNFRMLSDLSLKVNNSLNDILIKLQSQLFEWRQKSKHGLITNADFDRSHQIVNEWKRKSIDMDQFYTDMSSFSLWMQKDRDQLRRTYQYNQKAYQAFLPTYINVKEVYEVSSKNSTYHNIIKEEKRKFEAHLRNNYGMIVPYTVSDEYAKMVLPLQNPKNQELRELIGEELVPLEDGLNYVNRQYEKLYRDACDDKDGRLGVRSRIESYLTRFTEYSRNPNQDNTFAIHLIESGRKLLRIVK